MTNSPGRQGRKGKPRLNPPHHIFRRQRETKPACHQILSSRFAPPPHLTSASHPPEGSSVFPAPSPTIPNASRSSAPTPLSPLLRTLRPTTVQAPDCTVNRLSPLRRHHSFMQQVFPSPPTQTASAPQTPRALSSSSSQHGLQADHASGSGSQLVRSPSRGSVSVGSDATSGFASESWADGIDFERFNERLRRLSVADHRSGGQSPGKRIADHENAASPVARTARRRVEFKVIPRVGEAPPDSPSITDFPNGKRYLAPRRRSSSFA